MHLSTIAPMLLRRFQKLLACMLGSCAWGKGNTNVSPFQARHVKLDGGLGKGWADDVWTTHR